MIVTIGNQKGGVGKTAVAVHLAFRLAERGRRTALLDFDRQASATSTLVSRETMLGPNTTAALFAPGSTPALVPTELDNLWILPASDQLSAAEATTNLRMVDSLLRHVMALSEHVDDIVIDTPGWIGSLLTAALCCSDRVIVPLQAEMYSLDGLASIVAEIRAVRSRMNPNLAEPEFVLNMLKTNAGTHREVSQKIRSLYGDRAQHELHHYVSVSAALASRMPVWRYEPGKSAAREWAYFTDSIIDL